MALRANMHSQVLAIADLTVMRKNVETAGPLLGAAEELPLDLLDRWRTVAECEARPLGCS